MNAATYGGARGPDAAREMLLLMGAAEPGRPGMGLAWPDGMRSTESHHMKQLRIGALPETASRAPSGQDWTAFYDASPEAALGAPSGWLRADEAMRMVCRTLQAAPMLLALGAAQPTSAHALAFATLPSSVTTTDRTLGSERLADEVLHLVRDAVPVLQAVGREVTMPESRTMDAPDDEEALTFELSYDRWERRAHAPPPKRVNFRTALRARTPLARATPPAFVADEDVE